MFKNSRTCFFWGCRTAGGRPPPVAQLGGNTTSGEFPPRGNLKTGDIFQNVRFSKFQHTKSWKMHDIQSNIEVFKCHYAHFAHIHSPFGYTDEKMDLSIYLDTYSRHFHFPNSQIWKLKCCNMSGSIFRISKNPDMGKMGIGTKSRFSVYFPINSRSTTEWPVW